MLGFPFVQLGSCSSGGAKGGKMLTPSVAVSGKGKDGRVSPVLPRARRGAFPLAPLGSSPAVAGGSDFDLSTKMLICLAFPLKNLDFRK